MCVICLSIAVGEAEQPFGAEPVAHQLAEAVSEHVFVVAPLRGKRKIAGHSVHIVNGNAFGCHLRPQGGHKGRKSNKNAQKQAHSPNLIRPAHALYRRHVKTNDFITFTPQQ